MEEEAFSSTMTSFSTLSPQTNYQTLIDRETLNTSYVSSSSLSLNSSSSNSISPSNINSSSSSNDYPYAVFLFRPNNSAPAATAVGAQSNGGAAATANGSSTQSSSSSSSSNLNNSNSNNGELFEERRIILDKPCKIGRSVAKLRPEVNNAIFDCKVLSRNHALLWEENSKVNHHRTHHVRALLSFFLYHPFFFFLIKFYIQDTKSSNGTFLNGTRLGKSNEDST